MSSPSARPPFPEPASPGGEAAALLEAGFRPGIGSELCQTLLPSVASLRRASGAGPAAQQGLTLYTPPVDDGGLERIEKLLDALAALPGEHEVVANDWGVLRLLRARRARVRAVLGRLLTKLLRDPRIQPTSEQGEPISVPLPMQQSGITAPAQQELLRAHGVEWVEVDNLRHGLSMDFAQLGLRPSLHLPFGLVASGRVCLFAGVHQPRELRFSPGGQCQRECQQYLSTLRDPAGGTAAPMVQQGNTVFYRQDEALRARGLAWVRGQRGRVVLRRRPLDEVSFLTEDYESAGRWLQGVAA